MQLADWPIGSAERKSIEAGEMVSEGGARVRTQYYK